MSLAESGKAIGAVSRLLVERLGDVSGLDVQVGRPGAGTAGTHPKLNLFLYEAVFDPSLKNTPLDDGQPPPLWMVLRYLMTPYDAAGESDTPDAHDILGEACRALQESAFLKLKDTDADNILKPLIDNPQELRVTFVEATSDLLARLMQEIEEQRYRFSMAFEVRPVMIAMGTPPAYSLLVGVDYTQAPPDTIGMRGVRTAVIPSLGPVIASISPSAFEPGDTVTIEGTDLHLSGLSVRLGPVELPVTAQSPGWLKFTLRRDLVHGGAISAGAHPVTVVRSLPGGRLQRSNALLGELLPVLDSLTIISKSVVPPTPAGMASGEIELGGALLGTAADDVYVALYRDGRTVAMFDVLDDPPGPPPPAGTVRRFTIAAGKPVPAGSYVVLVRANGVQARNGLTVDLIP